MENALIYKFQSEFLAGHSTTHQLIEFINDIFMALDNRELICLILCDMGKFLIRWKYVISQRLAKNEIQRTSDFIVYFAMHLVTNTVGANCLIGIK
jgi:hypothetical protein